MGNLGFKVKFGVLENQSESWKSLGKVTEFVSGKGTNPDTLL